MFFKSKVTANCNVKKCFTRTIFYYRTSNINPIQDEDEEWGAKSPPPPTSFSPITFTNVGISPKNFLTFSFNPSDRLV